LRLCIQPEVVFLIYDTFLWINKSNEDGAQGLLILTWVHPPPPPPPKKRKIRAKAHLSSAEFPTDRHLAVCLLASPPPAQVCGDVVTHKNVYCHSFPIKYAYFYHLGLEYDMHVAYTDWRNGHLLLVLVQSVNTTTASDGCQIVPS
jgi:hypothetical protein